MSTVAAAQPATADAGKFTLPVKVLMVVAAIAAGVVAVYAVSGVYHLLDIISWFHAWWHGQDHCPKFVFCGVRDKATRNDVRDVIEYLTGGYAAQLYVWNSLKWHLKGGGDFLDKLDARIPLLNRFRQWVRRFPVTEGGVSYVLSLPAAAIGFTAVYFITRAIPQWSWHVPIPHFRHALTLSSIIVNHKAMGLAASYFFGRHMMRLWYDDMQWQFALEAARRKHNPLSFLWLPTFRRRVQEARDKLPSLDSGSQTKRQLRLKRIRLGISRALFVLGFLWFAFYGFLVLKYLAHGVPLPWGLR